MKIREAIKVFKKLKMKIKEGNDTLAYFYYKGELVVRSRVPHRRGELKGNLPHYVRQQLKLNEDQFRDICRCTKEYEDYLEILTQKDLIS